MELDALHDDAFYLCLCVEHRLPPVGLGQTRSFGDVRSMSGLPLKAATELSALRPCADSVVKLGEGWLPRNNRIVAKGFLNQWCGLVRVGCRTRGALRSSRPGATAA
jgi:hypothetical protein